MYACKGKKCGAFFVFRGLPAEARHDATLRVNPSSEEIIFDPQFSPNGTKILFKSGWPYDVGTSKIYMSDVKSRSIDGPLAQITYLKTLWSPNGRYVAYGKGSDTAGEKRVRPTSTSRFELHIVDLSTKKDHLVATSPMARSFTWTPQNTPILQY
jgi:Tol biopolymer transport system component